MPVTFGWRGLSATIDNLRFDASGSAALVASSPYVKDFNLQAAARVDGPETFFISAERLQASMGLKVRPDFDRIELAGQQIATIEALFFKGY